ncbi:TRZ/ATZ family hydrolase [Viridibacterium curvum]
MNQALERIDTLIEARWVVPVEPADTTLENHALAIRDGAIVALLPISDARLRFSPAETVVLEDHVLIPGLINLHTHTAMTLLRGHADDLPLMRWLTEAIWPAEREHVSEEFVYHGTLLGAAEMLRGGVTFANDMYFFPDAAARAYEEMGMRAMIGLVVLDFPGNYAANADDYLHKGLAVRDKWLGHSRLDFSLAPHAPYTVSDSAFERVGALAEELDASVHIHVQETRNEVEDSLKQYGLRPLQRLQKLGLLGPNLLIAHGVHVDDKDIELLALNQVGVAHNPVSNMKLASGIAPVTAMLSAGINVGLGTDGAASNNRLDVLQEMRFASLLAKIQADDAAALRVHKVLQMATLLAAKALGLQERIGSLTPGKRADICSISLNANEIAPVFDPVSHIVFAAGREHVSHVWVDGKGVLANGELLLQRNEDLPAISRLWQNSLQNKRS